MHFNARYKEGQKLIVWTEKVHLWLCLFTYPNHVIRCLPPSWTFESAVPSSSKKTNTNCPPKSFLKLVINPSSQKQCHCERTGVPAIITNIFFFFQVIVKGIYFECALSFVLKVQNNILLVLLLFVGRPAAAGCSLNCRSSAAVTNRAAVGWIRIGNVQPIYQDEI